MARLYTGNPDVIAVRNGYHGGSPSTIALTGLSTWKFATQEGAPVHHAACPDPYRSEFSGSPEAIASQAAADIRDVIRRATPGRIAGFIAEPIQGVGGVTYGAPNYLGEAYGIVRECGGICIADEVQTGFGRTGEHFWGFQHFGVVPDMVPGRLISPCARFDPVVLSFSRPPRLEEQVNDVRDRGSLHWS